MKMRTAVSPWIFGILGAVTLVALACGSSTADDPEAAQAQLAGGSGASGVLVTDRDSPDTGDATLWPGIELRQSRSSLQDCSVFQRENASPG